MALRALTSKPELVKSTHMLTQKQMHTPPLKGVLRDGDHCWITYSEDLHGRVKSIGWNWSGSKHPNVSTDKTSPKGLLAISSPQSCPSNCDLEFKAPMNL